MSNFLANYEDVQSRINRFKKAYPNGSIITIKELFQPENGWVLFRCEIRRDSSTQMPDSVDYAFGDKNEYPKHMARFYVEDTATSSQGRALNAILETDKKPTAQDMAKVNPGNTPSKPSKPETIQVADEWENFVADKPMPEPMDTDAIAAALGGEIIEEKPLCDVCGRPMYKKEGTKDGKAYFGYVCNLPLQRDEKKHPAKWYDLTSSGKWIYKPKKG